MDTERSKQEQERLVADAAARLREAADDHNARQRVIVVTTVLAMAVLVVIEWWSQTVGMSGIALVCAMIAGVSYVVARADPRLESAREQYFQRIDELKIMQEETEDAS